MAGAADCPLCGEDNLQYEQDALEIYEVFATHHNLDGSMHFVISEEPHCTDIGEANEGTIFCGSCNAKISGVSFEFVPSDSWKKDSNR
jgi:hypothetical protein